MHNVMLQIMKEDLALKKKSMAVDESNKSADANAMIKIADVKSCHYDWF